MPVVYDNDAAAADDDDDEQQRYCHNEATVVPTLAAEIPTVTGYKKDRK